MGTIIVAILINYYIFKVWWIKLIRHTFDDYSDLIKPLNQNPEKNKNGIWEKIKWNLGKIEEFHKAQAMVFVVVFVLPCCE